MSAGAGRKALGAASTNIDCWSGVRLIIARESPGPSKLANVFRLTRMYVPAVRRKRFSSICRRCGLASMYPASAWSGVMLRAIMDVSAHAVSLAARPRNGPNGSPGFACAGKTGPPSRLVLSQTSVGNGTMSSFSPSSVPLFVPSAVPSSRPAQHAGRRAQGPSRLAALRGHPQGSALTAPSTVPGSDRSG
jgi:hypothetical protein